MAKKTVDWQKVKDKYISSQTKTLREIATDYALAYSTVKRHAAQEDWSEERRKNIKRIEKEIKKEQEKLEKAEKIEHFAQREKMNRIADKLLDNIEKGTEIFEKPTHISTLVSALDSVKNFLRDINSNPSLEDERRYELAKEKLANDRAKKNFSDGESYGGVVVLPEVKNE